MSKVDSIEKLQAEMTAISQQIHAFKALIETTADPSQQKKLQKELKQLQWQALFYFEKIENLKNNY